ncbi:hypothetical protein GCM10022381_26040 [Leifsonia kafniensis]|uniref:Uncharacterized protein n=1 Tax=Leifsonia kafniensis TaxID=475957 RepID=A0ABP7KMX8_9MICO
MSGKREPLNISPDARPAVREGPYSHELVNVKVRQLLKHVQRSAGSTKARIVANRQLIVDVDTWTDPTLMPPTNIAADVRILHDALTGGTEFA